MPSRSKFPVNSVKILNGAVWTKCPDKFFCRSKIRPVPCELSYTACLHGGGGPQIGEVTCGGSPYLSCTRDQIKGLFTWRWGTPGRWGNLLRWGNPPCPYYLSLSFDDVYMIGGVTTWEIIWTGGLPHLSLLPHLPGVPHLHVNRP